MRLTVVFLFAFAAEWETNKCCPVPMVMVDLTHTFDNTTLNWPDAQSFDANSSILEYSGLRIQMEAFSSSTHTGTHLDAPCHFVEDRHTVTDIPLDRLFAPAAVVDIRDKTTLNSDYELQVDDLQKWENETGHLLNKVILLVRSGWSKYWSNSTAYMGNADKDTSNLHFPGVSVSAAKWLVRNRDVYGVGVEALSLDYGQSKNFSTHLVLSNRNIYGLENMDSMEELPIYGATLHVMPMKIGGGACGAPVRIVATFPELIFGSDKTKSTKAPGESLYEVIRFN